MENKEIEHGNYVYKHPHPALTTDCVVYGFDGKELHLLLIERKGEPFKGCWALPGGFLRMDETLEECAKRELAEETNVKDIYLEEFHTFSKVDRDPRERVVTVAFYALVRKEEFNVIGGDDAARAVWFKADELPALAFDHEQIILQARKKLQEKLRTEPIAFRLLDKQFALSELMALYQTINAVKYDRRNFFKKMLATGLIIPKGTANEKIHNRAPILYEFDEYSYRATYLQKRGKRKYPFDF